MERGLAKVSGPGFDPADVEWAEEKLAGYAATFGPRISNGWSSGWSMTSTRTALFPPTSSRPSVGIREALQSHSDGGYAGEFRLTGEAGVSCRRCSGRWRAAVMWPRPAMEAVEEPDDRTYGQRMHDALEQVCDRLLRADTAVPDAGGTPATVIITLDLADLLDKTGMPSPVTTLIPTEKALQLANAAEVYFAAVTVKGEVLQLGRSRRIATRSQTIALFARDNRCSFPGRDTAPEWTERHHVIPWSEGGSGPRQPDPALSLPPPQLPGQRLGV